MSYINQELQTIIYAVDSISCARIRFLKNNEMEKVSRRKKENVWDFALLNPLTEEAFLKTLHCRFQQDRIYTYIGNELIVVNPFKDLDIYNQEIAFDYFYGAPFQLPPHIFSVVSNAYRWLIDNGEDLCIIFFGESGSGKTEFFKKAFQFLLFVNHGPDSNSTFNLKDIMYSNIIVEAFGNAETALSGNSTRYCKFLDFEFDFKGDPLSASFTCYLLDKDRITCRSFEERNFHVFYQILCGVDVSILKILKLNRNVLSYAILKQSKVILDIEEEKQNFLVTKKSLEALNFNQEMIIDIFKIISAILKLGNLNFLSVTNIDGTEGCSISNEPEMYDVCCLLGIEASTFKTVSTCKNAYVLQHSENASVITEMLAEEAAFVRDGICKALYNRLFTWLVKSINSKIKLEPRYRRQHLSLLDMFGFENIEPNGFHQFVINYCNEKVFQTVFENKTQAEHEEYIREGIEWPLPDFSGSFLTFEYGEKVCEELLTVIDHFNNDVSVEHRLLQKLLNLKLTSAPVADLTQAQPSKKIHCKCFKLQHFAGEVTYSITNFASKNNDIIKRDISIMMYESSHPLLKILFPEGSIEMSSLKKQPSPSSKLVKIALNGILRNLNCRKLYYIRCIKPNNLKVPHIFEPSLVLRQVRAQRVIETIRFRRNGFTFSLPHLQFLNRYKMLSLKTWPSSRLSVIESIQYLLHDLPIPAAEFAFGSSKIFVRSPRSVYELEEYRRHRLHDIATIIQTIWRSYSQRKRFLRLRKSQMVVSAAWKMYKKMKLCQRNREKQQIDWAVRIIQRHFIQWKRYQFLKRVIDTLSPRTMSPINRDWPSCHIRFAECSLLLRKLHHKWRCQRYRAQFNQTARNKMREKVTASYLFKDKKCCYMRSVPKPFIGDYVRIRQNNQWKKTFYYESDQHVVFADVVNKIARATGKFIPILLVVSTNAVLMMDHRTLDIKYRIPASEIYCISLSPFEDNIAVIHIYSNDKNSSSSDVSQCFSSSSNLKSHSSCFLVADYYEKGDIIFQTSRVIEVVTKLFLVVQNVVGRSPGINILSSFNAYFHQQIVTISFYYMTATANMQSEQIKVVRKGNTMEVCIMKD